MKPRLLLVLLLLVGNPIGALACSCAPPGPACQSFWKTDSVFAGEVLAIEQITVPRDMGGSTLNMSQLVVRFRVNKAYRGFVGSEISVQTGIGGGDCGYHFERGHTYLVYGHIFNGTVHTGICSGTQPIEQATAALAWLDSLPSRSKDATIFGTVNQNILKDNQYSRVPAPGITVSLTDASGHQASTSTDSSGAYSIGGLAAGRYAVSAALPRGMTGATERDRVEVHEQGCAEVSFWMSTDGRISGHVLDFGGQPAKDITVALALADGRNINTKTDHVSFDRFANTDVHGGYEFVGLLPGKYLVFLNPFGFDEKRPYPRQFYGGDERLETATKIDVAESGATRDIDFRLPAPLTWNSVVVLVKDAQGLPIAGAQVSAHDQVNPTTVSGLRPQSTGPDGKVTLEVYAERSYYFTATINTEAGKQRCGGPVAVDPAKVNAVSIAIVHPIGNCMAYLNPDFKGPR
jgi:hypothetical protein